MNLKKMLIVVSAVSLFAASSGCQSLIPNNGGSAGETNSRGQNKSDVQNAPAKDSGAPQSETKKSVLPTSQDLDLQANHANGTVLRITRIDFAEDSTVLSFSVTNGHEHEIKLNQGGMQMRDNAGNQYNLSPPSPNAEIAVAPNTTIKGKLIFLGRISPAADALTLTTNYRYSYNSDKNENTNTPYIVINNIPVQR